MKQSGLLSFSSLLYDLLFLLNIAPQKLVHKLFLDESDGIGSNLAYLGSFGMFAIDRQKKMVKFSSIL